MKYKIYFDSKDTGLVSDKKEASLKEVQRAIRKRITMFEFFEKIEYKPIK